MKKRIVQIIVAGAFTVAPLFMFGQPGPGGNSNGTPVGGDPSVVAAELLPSVAVSFF
jgi:hypothetical protein